MWAVRDSATNIFPLKNFAAPARLFCKLAKHDSALLDLTRVKQFTRYRPRSRTCCGRSRTRILQILYRLHISPKKYIQPFRVPRGSKAVCFLPPHKIKPTRREHILWAVRDSNPRHQQRQCCALPAELTARIINISSFILIATVSIGFLSTVILNRLARHAEALELRREPEWKGRFQVFLWQQISFSTKSLSTI